MKSNKTNAITLICHFGLFHFYLDYVQLSAKLFIATPNLAHFALLYLRTNFSVAEVWQEYDQKLKKQAQQEAFERIKYLMIWPDNLTI